MLKSQDLPWFLMGLASERPVKVESGYMFRASDTGEVSVYDGGWKLIDGVETDFIRYIDGANPAASDANPGTDPTKPATFTVGVGIGDAGSMVWQADSMDLIFTITVAVPSINDWTLKSALTDAQVEGAVIRCVSGPSGNAGQIRTIAQGGDTDGIDPVVRMNAAFDNVPLIGDVYEIVRPNVFILANGTGPSFNPIGTINGSGNQSSWLDLLGIKLLSTAIGAPGNRPRFNINGLTLGTRMSEVETARGFIDLSGSALALNLNPNNTDLVNPLDLSALYLHSSHALGMTVQAGLKFTSINHRLVCLRAGWRIIGGRHQFNDFQPDNSPVVVVDGAVLVAVATTDAPAIVRNADAATQFSGFVEVFGAISVGNGAYAELDGLQFDPGTAGIPWQAMVFFLCNAQINDCINKPGAALMPGWGVYLIDGAKVTFGPIDASAVPIGNNLLNAQNVMGVNGAVFMMIGLFQSELFSMGTGYPYGPYNGATGLAVESSFADYPGSAPPGPTTLTLCTVDTGNDPDSKPLTNPANVYAAF